MNKRTIWQRVGDFIVGKGFYIVLFLCVATIGISGYYLVSAFSGSKEPSPSGSGQQVIGGAQVVIPQDDLPDSPSFSGNSNTPSTPSNPSTPDTPSVTDPAPDGSTPGGDSGDSSTINIPSLLDPPAEDGLLQPEEPSQEPAPSTQPQTPTAIVYTWPVKGEIISDFSLEVLAYDETMGDWRTHSGIDIAASAGTRVVAIRDGTVSQVYQDDLMGTTVVIDHGDGLVSRYYNLTSKPTVSEGDTVSTGTVIGAVGQTAIAEINRPAHLHLEMSDNGRSVDPVNYLPCL